MPTCACCGREIPEEEAMTTISWSTSEEAGVFAGKEPNQVYAFCAEHPPKMHYRSGDSFWHWHLMMSGREG